MVSYAPGNNRLKVTNYWKESRGSHARPYFRQLLPLANFLVLWRNVPKSPKKIISETCLLSSLSCSQIWLIPLVDDHHHKIEESPPLSAAEHQNVSSQQWSFKGTWLLPLTTD
jgi:hypothetical protein